MTVSFTEDPANIEIEIERTQNSISRTIDKIGDQLSIKNLFSNISDKIGVNKMDMQILIEKARQNPVGLGLIAGGVIWLISDKGSAFSSLMPRVSNDNQSSEDDPHHRGYISHMWGIKQGDEEDIAQYQRRRDTARADFFMIERNIGEDETTFRQRLDSAADKFRDKRRALADGAQKIQHEVSQTARAAVVRSQKTYMDNPAIGGLVSAALGAVLGAVLPLTKPEEDRMGPLGEHVRDLVDEHASDMVDQVKEKKDQMVGRATDIIQNNTTP